MARAVDRDIGQSVVSCCGAAASAVAIFHRTEGRGEPGGVWNGGACPTQQCTRDIMHRPECIRATRLGCTVSTQRRLAYARRATLYSCFRGIFRRKFMSFHAHVRTHHPPPPVECNIHRTASGITPSPDVHAGSVTFNIGEHLKEECAFSLLWLNSFDSASAKCGFAIFCPHPSKA